VEAALVEPQISTLQTKIREDLRRDGFSFCSRLLAELATAQVAHVLGILVNVSELLPESGIPVVQTLVPRERNEVGRNQYSGNYGQGKFPLHSDLAHWAVPPRYFMLRCIVESDDVFTHVLSWAPIVNQIGAPSLRRAVFTARKHRVGCSCLVRALSTCDGLDVMRWDPLFLRPLNATAQEVALAITSSNWNGNIQKILLKYPGDILLVDNWRSLYGRAAVPDNSTQRQIERIYLSEVYD
jgi:L-asparagine oxygenase